MRLVFPPDFSAALEGLRGNQDFATVLAGVEHCANIAVHEAMRAPVAERVDATAWARGMRELSVHLIATTLGVRTAQIERSGIPLPTVELGAAPLTAPYQPPMPPGPPAPAPTGRGRGAITGV